MNQILNLQQNEPLEKSYLQFFFSSFQEDEKKNLQTMLDRRRRLLLKAIPGFQIEENYLFISCREASSEAIEVYQILVEKIFYTARTRKWIKSGKNENLDGKSEKYCFRIWLNQLGLKGAKYARARKILTSKLSGNCAYPTEEKMNSYNRRRRALNENRKKKSTFRFLAYCKKKRAINEKRVNAQIAEKKNTIISTETVLRSAGPNSTSLIPTAVYCRISTNTPHQKDSLENQIRHYQEVLQNHPLYYLTKIYYDKGISGYKENRPGFLKMMKDAKDGCFRQIITKSITRFARNTDTVLKTTRWLRTLDIDVFFELQKIHSLSQEGELLLTLYGAFGQAESENARNLSKMMIQEKYKKGQPIRQLHRCLGYQKDIHGNLIPDENANLVRRIFTMAADGYSISEITKYLERNQIKTQNNKNFSRSSVSRILHNVGYKGDYVCQRYYVDAMRKLVKNKGKLPMYYLRQDHIPLVSEKLWEDAQKSLVLSRQRNQSAAAPVTDISRKSISYPSLSAVNYPYKDRIFCRYCGARLRRIIARNGDVWWICNTLSRKGKRFCKGIRIPDSKLQMLREVDVPAYLGKEFVDGKEIYGYSTEGDRSQI